MDPTTHILIGIAVPVVLGLGLAAARRPARLDPTLGAMILRHSWVYKGLGIAALGTFLFLFIAVSIQQGIQVPSDLIPMAIILGFAFIGGLTVLDGFRTQVALVDEGIISFTPWRGTRSFQWNEIEKVTFSYICGWFTITGSGRRRIRVNMMMVGIGDLANSIRRRLPPERYRNAERGFDAIEV
jgi:hypothetical protein